VFLERLGAKETKPEPAVALIVAETPACSKGESNAYSVANNNLCNL